MDLRELRDTLLRVDHPEKILTLADNYMGLMSKAGNDFRLPKEHAIVKPLLDYYSEDLAGWVKFVYNLRDRLPKSGRAYHAGVQMFLRRIETRLVQQQRRDRLDAAVNMAICKKLITDDFDSKMRYSRRCSVCSGNFDGTPC